MVTSLKLSKSCPKSQRKFSCPVVCYFLFNPIIILGRRKLKVRPAEYDSIDDDDDIPPAPAVLAVPVPVPTPRRTRRGVSGKRVTRTQTEKAERRQDWQRYMESFRSEIHLLLQENSEAKLNCEDCNKNIARGSILHHRTVQGIVGYWIFQFGRVCGYFRGKQLSRKSCHQLLLKDAELCGQEQSWLGG